MRPLQTGFICVFLSLSALSASAGSGSDPGTDSDPDPDLKVEGLLNISARARLSNERTLGDPQPEEFQEYDVSLNYALPWRYTFDGGWTLASRLMVSAGLMVGSEDTALVGSLIPGFALESPARRIFFDAGAGGALLSRYRFGRQDFGAPFQFALTAGATVPVYRRFAIGYRFLHYSDAGVHGDGTTGSDFHMIEFSYWF